MERKLSPLQLYALMLVFLLGTSIIFGTPRLVPDTWIVDLLTIVPSFLLAGLYLLLIRYGGGGNLFDMLVGAWGRIAGRALILVYTVYFLYIAARNLRDMLELIMTSLLRNTPGELVILIFVVIVAYAAMGGIVALGRLSVLIALMVILFFATLTFLLIFSGSVDSERLLPFLSEGLAKVAGSVFRGSLWFPYGELVVFLVFHSFFGGFGRIGKTGTYALLSSAVVLTFSDVLQICTLGIENKKFSVFALLDAARLINVANFITRMDALVAFIFLFGVLLKASVLLHAGIRGAVFLFKADENRFAYPLALLIGSLSLLVSRNHAEHVSEGLIYAMYWLHLPLQLGVPLATLILLRMRGPGRAQA